MNLRIRVSPFCCLRTCIYVSYLLVTFYLISRLDLVVEQSDEAKVQRSKDCSPETTRDVTSGSRESTSFTLEDGLSSGDVTSSGPSETSDISSDEKMGSSGSDETQSSPRDVSSETSTVLSGQQTTTDDTIAESTPESDSDVTMDDQLINESDEHSPTDDSYTDSSGTLEATVWSKPRTFDDVSLKFIDFYQRYTFNKSLLETRPANIVKMPKINFLPNMRNPCFFVKNDWSAEPFVTSPDVE